MTTEKRLETNFVAWCKARRIAAIKGPAMFAKGIPDRYVQLPNGGGTIYVEFKGSSYYGLTPLQLWWKEYLTNSDPHRYYYVENDAQLEALKQRCVKLMEIGAKIVELESTLLQ